MNIFEIICGGILVLVALAIIVLTGAQENKSNGLSGAIMGSSDTMSAGRSRSNDAKMAKLTKICARRWWLHPKRKDAAGKRKRRTSKLCPSEARF